MKLSTVWKSVLESLTFLHSPAGDFVQSQWQTKSRSVVYLIYKWILAAYFIGILILSVITSERYNQIDYYMIYLTNWGVILCTLSTVYGAILTTVWHFNSKLRNKLEDSPDNNHLPVCFKIYWFIVNGATVLALLITILYWTLLYKGSDSDVNNFLTHAGNSIGMGLDLLIARWPCHILHVFYAIGAGIVYLLFSGIYFLAGGENGFGNRYIYSVLNWEEPGKSTVTSVGAVILAIVCQCIVYLIQKLRSFGYRKIHEKILKISTSNA